MNNFRNEHRTKLLFFSLGCIFLLSSLSFSQSPSYETIKFDLTFTSDHGSVEVFGGYFNNNQWPRGFREGSLKLTYNGSLSHFSMTPSRIQVIKYQQYDSSPVRITVLCDIPEGWNKINVYTRKGQVNKITGKIYDSFGKFLGQFEDSGSTTWNIWKEHIIDFSSTEVTTYSLISAKEFNLQQNYPNPFNPNTTIEYSVDNYDPVNLTIYNQLGEIVNILVNEIQEPGNYKVFWDGTDNNGRRISSGNYYYVLKQGEKRKTQKMILLQ